ncbi:uncharacterized protein LOC142319565 isoform X4 [Lycorma delicatula]|uniref:uncharacterized protein LOC142319565 isoform X4 n=1 Tax=Lycorma delicatula TaxID=130591 RepID=UPI003F515B2C
MVELIPKQIWNWVLEGWRNMADLADKIDDLICSFEGIGDTTMDTVAMYLFGWMLFGLTVLAIGRYVYGRFISVEDAKAKSAITEPPVAVAKTENSVEASAKPASKENKIKQPAATGGKYVPPTPPVRKRLGSKSGRPVGPAKPKSSVLIHPPPTATGPESESVKWVNELFLWLYSDLVIVSELLNLWVQSLNEFTKESVAEHGVGVEFVRVLGETQSPSLTNVFCECAPNDDVTITCDCEATPALQLKVFRQKGEKVEVSHYRVNVNRFRARLSILAVTEKMLADVKVDGWPEIKVSLAQVGAIKNNLDESQLQDVILEIVTVALRNSSVHINLGQYPTCPRLTRYIPPPSHLLPVHYDSLLSPSSKNASIPSKTASKRLLVKIIKATGLASNVACAEPFCVVELDDPPQKNQTSIKKDTSNPTWEEHFLFDVSDTTAEILFEVYDKKHVGKGDHKFLGLGIVGMDELLVNPSQRQTISLQSRPYQEDPVSGTLTVEFLFIEGAEIPVMGDKPYKLKETLRSISPSGATITTTKTVFSKTDSERLTNGGDITDSALREIERNKQIGGPTQTSKSTLIIHSVQRQPQRQLLKDLYEYPYNKKKPAGIKETMGSSQDSPQPQQHSVTLNVNDDRGRSRRKKRDFFGTIKRRLNRSKTRSKSVDPGEYEDSLSAESLSRSISADRARDPSAHSTGSHLSVPGLREGSARSSLSEASGVSGMSSASTRTYVNEASTLILEAIENGIKKYYLVPLSLAQKGKWKKKGTKLHIFNDHTFIAKHLPGGTQCHVCAKMLARRLGKQGYECRDCLLKCHKHCHIRADTNCPSSNIHAIELVSNLQSPFSVRKNIKKR